MSLTFGALIFGSGQAIAAEQRTYTPGNMVFDLDGRGDYVELPGDLFVRLQDATVECWVRWKEWGRLP